MIRRGRLVSLLSKAKSLKINSKEYVIVRQEASPFEQRQNSSATFSEEALKKVGIQELGNNSRQPRI
jgi:transcriptional antiterminator Rof (Rho-off)